MGKQFRDSKKRTNPVLWFLFAIIIPLIIAITITIFILVFIGVDVKGWTLETANKIPIISSLIKTDEVISLEESKIDAEEKVAKQQEELELLNGEITDLKDLIENLEQDLVKAKNTMKTEEEIVGQNEEKNNEINASLKVMAGSFKKMDKKQAALIFADLDQETAVNLLQELPNDIRGGILEAMESKLAAKLTEQFIKR